MHLRTVRPSVRRCYVSSFYSSEFFCLLLRYVILLFHIFLLLVNFFFKVQHGTVLYCNGTVPEPASLVLCTTVVTFNIRLYMCVLYRYVRRFIAYAFICVFKPGFNSILSSFPLLSITMSTKKQNKRTQLST